MTEPDSEQVEVPDYTDLTANDLHQPEPNHDEDDDTLGPPEDDAGLLSGIEPPLTPNLELGYPVDDGDVDGYEAEPGDSDGHETEPGDEDGYEVNL